MDMRMDRTRRVEPDTRMHTTTRMDTDTRTTVGCVGRCAT